jgi:hypothetical protein
MTTIAKPMSVKFRDNYVESSTGCWEWTGRQLWNGYGAVGAGVRGRALRAHRVSYELNVGPIPHHLVVCHTCDNRKCVNPNHLFLGTRHENNTDMATKGRARGAPRKLTDEQVYDIRKLSQQLNSVKLAELFGVTSSAIKLILQGARRPRRTARIPL